MDIRGDVVGAAATIIGVLLTLHHQNRRDNRKREQESQEMKTKVETMFTWFEKNIINGELFRRVMGS
jgi:hypothetical protein